MAAPLLRRPRANPSPPTPAFSSSPARRPPPARRRPGGWALATPSRSRIPGRGRGPGAEPLRRAARQGEARLRRAHPARRQPQERLRAPHAQGARARGEARAARRGGEPPGGEGCNLRRRRRGTPRARHHHRQSFRENMKKLRLTLACWPYDRTRALADGSVRLEGIDLVYLPMEVEETFWRQARFQEFDASEMSLSSYVKTLNSDKPPFIAIPVFPSRSFRHSCIFVSAKSGIRKPEDLKGKRVAAPEYQMTAPVWIRGILADDFGVKATDVQHFSGGEEEPGREEKLQLDLPKAIDLKPIGPKQTLSRMLVDGELDALVTSRAPPTFYTQPAQVTRPFPD